MAMQFKMNFTKTNWSPGQVVELGSIENTVWSMTVSTSNGYGGFGTVDILRSRGNGQVKIDARVDDQGCNLLMINGTFLTDGVSSKRFNLTQYGYGSSVTGYVRVYYTLETKLTNEKEEVPTPQLVKDLLQLLDKSGSFSDAVLVSGASKIPVHRNILSARSPVFAAMFKTQMEEGREGVVDIVDVEPDVLQAMLRYVYSGKTDNLTNSLAGDLLFAADKYQLEELKLICVKELKASMDVNNVFRSLVLGDLHEKTLKVHAVDYICKCKYFSDLEKTEEWQSLLKERSSLAVEVLTTVVKHVQEKLSNFQ